MKINGLQKMTLLDYPDHIACTVFIAGCNYKCPYCHNSELINKDAEVVMDDSEFFKFLEKRKGLLDGVAVTGGEPLLNNEIEEFLVNIKKMGYPVKLDTNGSFPNKLKNIIEKDLVSYVAMDIKNSKERYAQTVGLNAIDISKIKESINLLMNSSVDYEFRTTVVDELFDDSSFIGISEMIKGAKRYFLQAFTDRDTVVYSGFSAPSKEKMYRYRDIMKGNVERVELRGVE